MTRGWPALVLLLAVPLFAEEGAEDSVSKLPGCLRRGASARYERSAGFGRLRAEVEFRVAEGELRDAVAMVLTTETAEAGPLTEKTRLHAVLDAKTRRIASFTYEVAKGEGAELRLVSELGRHPENEEKLLFRRYDVGREGERRERRTKVTPPDALWAPEPLEPFLASLLSPGEEGEADLVLMDVETGRLSRTPATYRALGEGKMTVGETEVSVSIWRRKRGGTEATIYRRIGDAMPVKDEAARLAMRPEDGKEEGR